MAKRYERFGDMQKAIDCWKEFAVIKKSKGSYFLAYYGLKQVSRLYGMIGEDAKSKDFLSESDSLKLDESYLDIYDKYFFAFELEVSGKIRDSIDAYENVAKYFIEIKNYFLAADAYEHAAENRYKLGMAVKNYSLPHEAWMNNSRYWMDLGEADDSKWSEERKKYYNKLYRE